MPSGDGSVKEAPGTLEVKSNKVTSLRVSVSQGSIRTDCAECSVGRVEVPGGLLLIQARLGYRIDDEACFVAVLSRRRSGNYLHRLNRVGRQLSREGFALLIGNRLVVDRI